MDPYEVLLIDPEADDEEIERAYRQRVIDTHPDQGGSVGEFRAVRAAYEQITAGDANGYGGEGTPADPDVDGAESRPDKSSTDEPEGAHVEYLDYEVLADHGWDLDDDGLFERAADANLDHEDYGRFVVQPGETVLQAAENRGYAWPFACRGGACANCAVLVVQGEMSIPVNTVLPPEMLDRDVRLSCVGEPTTDELRLVFNVKHLPVLDDLRLPPRPFVQAQDD